MGMMMIKSLTTALFCTTIIVSLEGNYLEVFNDPFFWIVLILGIIAKITVDDNREKVGQKINLRYIVFSIDIALVFCLIIAIMKSEEVFVQRWVYYSLVLASALLSPSIARGLIAKLPNTIVNGVNNATKSQFDKLGGGFNETPENAENEKNN